MRKTWTSKTPEQLMLHAARRRAKKAGIPFNLVLADIVIPELCPVLGVRLERGEGAPIDASPSLDKVIPALGYVAGNVVVISYRANFLKSNATLGEITKLHEFYASWPPPH